MSMGLFKVANTSDLLSDNHDGFHFTVDLKTILIIGDLYHVPMTKVRLKQLN